MDQETIIGIDLGTTNSEVAVIRDGRPVVLPGEDGDPILPSVVGLDPQGNLLVGKAARNQYVLAPERTIRSIKRKMGQETTVTLGDQKYTPQEISAIILRTLKRRAETALGHPVSKAVITVPAFFNDGQRQATREAGELAGLEVVRIINEPTAAVLTYDPHPTEMERLLVYDLGGGTFDVSLAQVENGVVEIRASHGDTQLGGDDFDQLLLDHICDAFAEEHGVDLRATPASKARVLRAAEDAKKRLSSDAGDLDRGGVHRREGRPAAEPQDGGRPPRVRGADPPAAAEDADLPGPGALRRQGAGQPDRQGGAGGRGDPDPAGPRAAGGSAGASGAQRDRARPGRGAGRLGPGGADRRASTSGRSWSTSRRTPSASRRWASSTGSCRSTTSRRSSSGTPRCPPAAPRSTRRWTTTRTRRDIRIFQGENPDTRYNTLVGEFKVEGLAEVPAGNQILVRLDLDLSGILKVTATERATGLAKHVVIDNAMERFRKRQRSDAVDRLEAVMGSRRAGEPPRPAGAGGRRGRRGDRPRAGARRSRRPRP